jgi:3-deoxy-D-manno-octulosonic-acid transferase
MTAISRSFSRIALPGLYRSATGALSRVLRPLIFRGTPEWSWKHQSHFENAKTLEGGPIPGGTIQERTKRDGARTQGEAPSGARLVWFHAASSGELEMLWSVAHAIRQLPEFSECRFGLTVFSPSGRPRLDRFRSEFSAIYCGPSPWEGEWSEFFERVRSKFGVLPSLFITAKYECWPELWGTLLEAGVPVTMINSEWRRSLRWGAAITQAVFGRLPRSKFFTVFESAARELARCFPAESASCSGDPRWDQVVARLGRPHPRVQELRDLGEAANLPRPWVVVGSAWEEDLRIILSALPGASFSGTLWIVPHRPSAEQARDWMNQLVLAHLGEVWFSAPVEGEPRSRALAAKGIAGTPSGFSPAPQLVLVQEMGILAELYSIGDAAWVGGGFRTGLHSVIEPALSDLWIAAGASTAGRFPEVSELVRLGQLELIHSSAQAAAWLDRISNRPAHSTRESWREWRKHAHLGAARRIAGWVAEIVSGPGPV